MIAVEGFAVGDVHVEDVVCEGEGEESVAGFV